MKCIRPMKLTYFFPVAICFLLMACSPNQQINEHKMELFTLTNSSGMKVTITNFGGKVVSLHVPDKNGNLSDVVLGYDSLSQYPEGNPYYGALIGRFGNRIANARFSLNGEQYQLEANNGPNALHGGSDGFHNVLWNAKAITTDEGQGVELVYESKDGEEGYPGHLRVSVVYLLSKQNELIIGYDATTTKPTVVNMTHHSFFNLKGEGNGDILGHQFEIFGENYLPVDSTLIPTGEIRSVQGSPFDFLQPHTAGERINEKDVQLEYGNGYDHCYVFNQRFPGEMILMARVTEPLSGRVMEVFSTEPGLQFYSGNFLSNREVGKGGKTYDFRSAFCLEPQHYPDSPNKPNFPSTMLNPNEHYNQRTIYKFSTVNGDGVQERDF